MPDTVALVAWLHKDALIAALDREIASEADDKAALSHEAREKAVAETQADLLAVERDESWFVWQAQSQGLPVLLHTGTTFIAQAPLEYTLPRHLDRVAMRFPGAKIIMAHLGHPYEGECVAVARKHPNVYADISALHYRPFQLYHSLMLVQEYGIWDKILFGTDYPFTTVNATIDGLHRLNGMLEGTNLPRLNTEKIDAMIHRDTLTLLGLSTS